MVREGLTLETALAGFPWRSLGRGLFRGAIFALALFATGYLAIRRPTPRYIGAVEGITKPAFPFEVVWEDEFEPEYREAIILISPWHYSAANVRQVLFWYAKVYEQKKGLHIKLFTSRNRAVPKNLYVSFDSWRSLFQIHPWDAYYGRSGVQAGEVTETYGYNSIAGFPRWRKDFVTRDDYREFSPQTNLPALSM